jgi:hypothetical protein
MILVVANRTPSTPMLMQEVARCARADAGARFTVLIPPEKGHDAELDWTPEEAQRLLSQAAGSEVDDLDAGADALDAIHGAVNAGDVDSIIVSAHTAHPSRWVHHDLTHRVEHLGLPITVIPPEEDVPDDLREGLPTGAKYPTIEPFSF